MAISTTLNGLSSFLFTCFLSLVRITFHVHLVSASQTMLIGSLLYWVSFEPCIFISHYSDHASHRNHYWLCFWTCVSIIFKLIFSDNGSSGAFSAHHSGLKHRVHLAFVIVCHMHFIWSTSNLTILSFNAILLSSNSTQVVFKFTRRV